MAAKISWLGIGVGALVGGIGRVTVVGVHFPDSLGSHYPVALIAAAVGIVIGGVAGGTGRILFGAVVGAALSILFYLLGLPLTGLLALLGAATPPVFWEVLAVGIIPGAIGGAVGQIAAKRNGRAADAKDSLFHATR